MAKISGSTLEFWYGGVGYAVNSASFDASWDEIDTTDSATATPSSEFIVNRAKRSTKVEADLADVDGAEKTSGTCTLGTRYKVTGGTITEGSVTYPVGYVFMSDGTGACNASNKVKPLGAKLPGKSIVCSFGGANTAVIGFKMSETYGEFDSTDSNSTGDSTEFITGRVKRTGSIDLILQDTVADLITANPASTAIILTFGTSLTLTGNAILTKKSISAIAKGDMVKASYEMVWLGGVTSTLANVLPAGTSTATVIKWKGHGTTDKKITGNAIVTTRSFEVDVNSIAKASYDLEWVGAVTEAVYS